MAGHRLPLSQGLGQVIVREAHARGGSIGKSVSIACKEGIKFVTCKHAIRIAYMYLHINYSYSYSNVLW